MVLLLLGNTALANMAAVSATAVQRTGNISPRQKAAIHLDYERLSIRLEADRAVVSVEYDFINNGGDENVTIGFPVDLMPLAADGTGYNLDHWFEESLTGFQIYDGGRRVAIEQTVEESIPPESRARAISDVSTVRHWSIAVLRFKRGEHKYVHVDYTVRCIGVDRGFEGTMDHSEFTPRTFLYALRPASTWGNGRLGKLDVTIDASFLHLNRFDIIQIEPKPQGNNGGILRWSFDDVDLKTAPDFACTYDATPALFQARAEAILFKRFDNLRFEILNPTATYATAALFDRNPGTAWCGGGNSNGTGACFSFRPLKNTYISQIAVLNGCWSNATAYAVHARIKKLRIEYVAQFEEGRQRRTSEQLLPDRKFEERALRFPTYYADFINLPNGPEGILEDVKLTVLELYPATGSKPLAVSDLYVYGSDLHKR